MYSEPASRLHRLREKDLPTSWLEKPNDVEANRDQWRLCCHLLSNRNDRKTYVYTFGSYSVLGTLAIPVGLLSLPTLHIHCLCGVQLEEKGSGSVHFALMKMIILFNV